MKCKNCLLEFLKKDYRQIFCGHRCATIYNNIQRGRDRTKKGYGFCLVCKSSLSRFQHKFCSQKCCGENARRKTALRIVNGDTVDYGLLRKYLHRSREHKCVLCNNTTWMGKPIPLTMDHINGNPTDHRLENLRLICPNCDRFLPTFGSRNKGHGRQSHGLRRR